MMADVRACRRLAAVACLLATLCRPAGAQSRSSPSAVHDYVAIAVHASTPMALPPNLVAAPMYRPMLDAMIHNSATFRRQCVRIGSERQLTIQLGPATPGWTRGGRALTRIVRQRDGSMVASIGIGLSGDTVELIAHELEHVIEQLDEVDLAVQAALPDTGVHALEAGGFAFETVRAVRVGLTVAQEVRAGARRAD